MTPQKKKSLWHYYLYDLKKQQQINKQQNINSVNLNQYSKYFIDSPSSIHKFCTAHFIISHATYTVSPPLPSTPVTFPPHIPYFSLTVSGQREKERERGKK